VLVGLRLELLTAKIGSIDNAQSTVVGARYVPVYRTEAFTCTSFYCDTSLAIATRQQLLQITFTVSFLDVTQKAEGVNEHQPQVIRKLPHNFFYPFS
jgi:tectonic-1/3